MALNLCDECSTVEKDKSAQIRVIIAEYPNAYAEGRINHLLTKQEDLCLVCGLEFQNAVNLVLKNVQKRLED